LQQYCAYRPDDDDNERGWLNQRTKFSTFQHLSGEQATESKCDAN
jgi:hypothetical protein